MKGRRKRGVYEGIRGRKEIGRKGDENWKKAVSKKSHDKKRREEKEEVKNV